MAIRMPAIPPNQGELVKKLVEGQNGPAQFLKLLEKRVGPEPDGAYRPWDTVQHLDPPDGMTVEEWWLATKFARGAMYRPLPILDKEGKPFVYALTDTLMQLLSEIDRNAGGHIQLPEEVTNAETRDRYIVSSLIEEAITSSQLEGASTTRRVAKEMLRNDREPQDRSEQMIRNNYLAMQHIQQIKDEKFTVSRILELHGIVTDGTLDDPAEEGQFRTTDDVKVWSDDTILHDPPLAVEIDERMKRMCDFANEGKGEPYVHAVIRAITLHFWLGYVHPFADGNGRTARALFYWSMLKSGLWLVQFVSISRLLRKAWAKYARSYLHTETDDNDLTYFLLYNAEVLHRAINGLMRYLTRKARDVRQIVSLLRDATNFNHRQLALLGHALKHPLARYSIKSHQVSHNVVYETARTDLAALENCGLLISSQVGRKRLYNPARDLENRLRAEYKLR
ncbi:Fic family protein [bacterium]|nr:MAG: Fic family protein [bacterium]